MKYAVFVDIDGVLTSSRVEFTEEPQGLLWSKFDENAIRFFNRIHDTYDGVEFVLISTWRDWMKYDDAHINLWIVTAFRNAGFRGTLAYPNWKVNPLDDPELHRKRRAHEIKDYLDKWQPEIEDYIIFDDTDFDFNSILGKKRYVRTDADNGILHKHMRNAWSIMGLWDKKS